MDTIISSRQDAYRGLQQLLARYALVLRRPSETPLTKYITQSIVPAIVSDLFFIHERAAMMAW
jgi:hypothetical protein